MRTGVKSGLIAMLQERAGADQDYRLLVLASTVFCGSL